MKNVILVTLSLCFLLTGEALSQTANQDIKDSKDHPLLTRMPDFWISEYKEAGLFDNTSGYKLSFIGVDPVGSVPDYFWIKSYRNGVFNGKGIELNFTMDGGGGVGTDGLIFIPPIAEGITPVGESFEKFDVCRVEIHSISEQAYNFFSQVYTQTTNIGLFATSPENVKTNINLSDIL